MQSWESRSSNEGQALEDVLRRKNHEGNLASSTHRMKSNPNPYEHLRHCQVGNSGPGTLCCSVEKELWEVWHEVYIFLNHSEVLSALLATRRLCEWVWDTNYQIWKTSFFIWQWLLQVTIFGQLGQAILYNSRIMRIVLVHVPAYGIIGKQSRLLHSSGGVRQDMINRPRK